MRVRQVLVLLTCLSASAYFAHHAIYGRHGLIAREDFMQRANLLDFEIESLQSVEGKLRRDVALLAPEIANPDMIEEIARDVLGYVHPRDRILPQN